MKTKLFAFVISLWAVLSLHAQTNAQTNERYIEVTGTSEIEIVPDKIHYLIEIREYFEEEFDGKSLTGSRSPKNTVPKCLCRR